MLDLKRFSLSQLEHQDLAGQRVLVRLDLNLPLANGQITDDFRLARSLGTLRFLLARGAKVLAVSHLGSDPRASLSGAAKALNQYLPTEFVPDWRDGLPAAPRNRPSGAIWLLENLRRDPGEETNDPAFAGSLAALADIFVNEAFAVSHRPHASVVGLPRLLPSFVGENFAAEVAGLSGLFSPAHPFIIILGGAKFGTKLPLVEKFLPLADKIFIYGALANVFFRSLGIETGQSLVDGGAVIDRNLLRHPKIILPVDVRVRVGARVAIKKLSAIEASDNILDIGLESIEKLVDEIALARTILWNGPVGLCEQGFTGGTKSLAQLVAASRARTVIGGGDTVAAVAGLGLLDQFGFVSTGGGAMLDFLARGTLPGIEALAQSPTFKI